MLEWGWYTDQNTKTVFIHCLLKANWKDAEFLGVTIERGSFVSSYSKMAKELKLSVQSVRTAINHLISTSELTIKGYSKFTVFTVSKYNDYQEANKQTNKQLTNNQQTTNNNRRKKEDKEIKNNIYSDIPELNQKILDFKEHRKLLGKPMTEYAVKLMIGKLNKITVDYDIQIKILEQSIDNGWQGIFPLKDNVQKSASQPKPNKFNSFEGQRDYDFASIEKQLLENNK